MSKQRILIIGGGFAGVHAAVGAAKTLRRARAHEVSAELVSPDPYLVIRPRLYESDLEGVRVPLGGVLGPIGVRHHRGTATEIDVENRAVRLADGSGLDYDQLVLATGSRLALPACTAGARVHAADTHAQAVELHDAVDRTAADPASRLSAVVVGAGFTGIELAAELAGTLARAAQTAGRPAASRVTLVERRTSVAPEFGPRARRVIERALSGLGVEVRADAAVSEVRHDGVALKDGSLIGGELVVWAAGPRASALTEQIPGPRDELGRLRVDACLATEADGVWAAGDAAAAHADRHHTAPMSCQHARPQGRRAGENAAAAALARRPKRYRQPLYLTCLDLGDYGALLTCGFDRNTILAAGPRVKALKRYINHSLIYPPIHATAEPAA